MGKKKWFGLLVLCACFLTFAQWGAPPAAWSQKAAPMKLRLSVHYPPTSVAADLLKKAVAEVEQRTEGRIKIEIYWSESLLKGREVLRGVEKGAANMGWVASLYNPAELQLNNAYGTIFYSPKAWDAGWVARKVWDFFDRCKEVNDEYKKWGQAIWYIHPFDGYNLATTPKKVVRTCQDIRGLRIRVPGQLSAKMISAVDGRPTFIPMGDIYQALEKGTLDGTLVGVETTKRFSFYEVTPNIAETELLLMWSNITIALRDVEKMSEKDRKIFFEIGRRGSIEFGDALKKEKEEIKVFLEKKGVKFIPFPVEERTKWANTPVVRGLMKNWIDEQNAAGRPGKKVMDILLDTFEVPR